MQTPTHQDLVARAETWLRNSAAYAGIRIDAACRARCAVVLTEFVACTTEVPDAIGWANAGRISFLVECKVSRADFLRDRKKWFRARPHVGMGVFRYYLTPKGMVSLDELPGGWGLLELSGRSVKVTRLAVQQSQRNQAAEMAMLWSQVRRFQAASKDKV